MELTITLLCDGHKTAVSVPSGSLLSEAIGVFGHSLDMPCGGQGRCGKCRVIAHGALSAPTPAEAALLGDDLARGIRLACMARVLGTAELTLPERNIGFSTAVTDGMAISTAEQPLYKRYGLAVDIGTTTLAAKLLCGGKAVASATAKNPQTAFGADVISRVGAALSGKGAALAACVRAGIEGLVAELCTQAKLSSREIDAAVVTGNTAMLHLFAERDPTPLSAAPFAAEWLAGERITAAALGLSLAPGAEVYLPRCISAFVGADITTALLASGITAQCETALLVDIGTNGEMALWHNGALTCCSTAAGPAFEGAGISCGMHGVSGAIDHIAAVNGAMQCSVIGGGTAVGLCGSGVIDAVAAMLTLGALDETGRIDEDCPNGDHIVIGPEGARFLLADGVTLTGKDIRAVQLAKSAIRAGLETLLTFTPQPPARLLVAGGFGSYLNLTSAAAIGLIPPALRPQAEAIGNAALSGAVMLLSDRSLLPQSEQLAASAATLELSTHPVFLEQYMEQMMF